MKQRSLMMLAIVMAISLFTGDVLARGGRSGGMRSSSSRSSSSSSRSNRSGGYKASKPKTPAQKAATVKANKARSVAKAKANKEKAIATAKANKIKTAKKAKTTKDKADSKKDAKSFKKMDTKSPAYSKTDKELQKNIGKSGKTFKSRSDAKASMTKKMADKKYDYKDNKTAMASRPSYVPQNHMIGGVGYPTSYYGGYYGYHNPLGVFVAYSAMNMMINDTMLHSYGYRPYVRPPYHPMSPIGGTVTVILILGILGTVIFVSTRV